MKHLTGGLSSCVMNYEALLLYPVGEGTGHYFPGVGGRGGGVLQNESQVLPLQIKGQTCYSHVERGGGGAQQALR